MVRPYLFIGIATLLASFFALDSGQVPIAVIMVSAALITLIFTVVKKKKVISGIILVVVCLLVAIRLCSVSCFVENKNKTLLGRTAEIKGSVVTVVQNENNFSRYTLKIEESNLKLAKGTKVSAFIPANSSLVPGDKIEAKVVFEDPNGKYKATNFANGRYYDCTVESFRNLNDPSLNLNRAIYFVREEIRKSISKGGSSEESAVLLALIIGDKSNISKELSLNVKRAGVSHMLVVSGLHLGILCGFVFRLLQSRINRLGYVLLGSATVVFMAAICLFHVSVLRASIVYLVMLLSRLVLKNYDSLNALGLGIILVVLIFPYAFYNVAFLLSVSATFSVIGPADMLIKAVSFNKMGVVLGKVTDYVYGVLVISVCAIICTLPITVYYFGFVVLIAPITNLVVSFAVSVALIVGVFAVVISFLPFGQFLCLPFFAVARAAAGYFIHAVNTIGSTEFGVLKLPNNSALLCFIFALFFVLAVKFFYDLKLSRKERAVSAKRKNLKISP